MVGNDRFTDFGGDACDIYHQSAKNQPSNAYTHRNVIAIRDHHERGVVPREFVVIAAEVLQIEVHQVRVAKEVETAVS